MAIIYNKTTDNRAAQTSFSDLVQDYHAYVLPVNESIQKNQLSLYPIFSESLFVTTRRIQSQSRKRFPKNIIEIMEYLVKLTRVDPNFQDEDRILNPSSYAVRQSVNFLEKLYNLLGDDFPRGFASLESGGGVNLIWSNDIFDKEARVEIPYSSDLTDSIYYCDDERDEDRLIENPSPVEVANILSWLSTNEPII